MTSRADKMSAVIYTGISAALALAFWLATGDATKYSAVARYGGAMWVFLLAMIVTMPLVTGRVKDRPR